MVRSMTGQCGPRRDVAVLDLTVTSRCNLSCAYCYRVDGPSHRMTWPTARSALDHVMASARSRVAVNLLGGEPLLEPALIERILRYLGCHRRSQVVSVSMTTNGLLLDDSIAALLAAHRVRTQISFDGWPASQAARGSDTIPALEARFAQLRSHHRRYWSQQVGTTITVTPQSVRRLADAVRITLRHGVRRIELSPDLRDTSSWDAPRFGELQTAFEELCEIAVEAFYATGDVPIAALRPRPPRPAAAPSAYLCGAPFGAALSVDADGQAYGCAMFAPAALGHVSEDVRDELAVLRLGGLLESGFEARFARYPSLAEQVPLFHRSSRTGSTLAQCDSCRHRTTCNVCPLVAASPAAQGLGVVPDFLCGFQLAAGDARDRVADRLRSSKRLLGMGIPPVLGRVESAAGRLQNGGRS